MSRIALAATVVGLAVIAALVGYFGAGAVVRSLVAIGWIGFAAVCAIHLLLIAVAGVAWGALLPGARLWQAMWARLIRDSAAEALPLSQVGGYVLGGRALTVAGVPATPTAASTIVDVTLEFLAQLVYTALGLLLLVRLQPDSDAALPVLFGLVGALVAAAIFVAAQRRGFALFDRLADRMAGFLGMDWVARGAAGAAALHEALGDIYRRRLRLWASFLLHLACWIATTIEVWLALRLAGEPLGFGAVLAIESLLYAIRTAAFLVPQAVGVQEGAYILLGVGFGLSPDMALALSLLKRARDLAIGLPAIAAWQAVEGRRLWRRRPPRADMPARVRGGAAPPRD